MNPTVIQGWTQRFGQPQNWDPAKDGHCGVLHIRREIDEQGNVFMASAWEPTPAEIAMMMGGGKVILRVSCPQHPVTSIGVEAAVSLADGLEELRAPPPG